MDASISSLWRLCTRALLVVLLAGGLAPSALAAGLVAAYSFDAGSGTTAASATSAASSLSLRNGVQWASGRHGSALAFDGTNDVAVANSHAPALDLTGRSLTISAWIYPRSNSTWQLIVDKPFGDGHYAPYFDWSMHRERGTGRLNAFFGCEGLQRPSNSSIPLNVWTHVAITYDGAALRHYINGVLDRTTQVTCAISNTRSRPIRVGANGAGTEVMNGAIDEVRIYDRPLSANEIQNDMLTPLGNGGSSGGGDAAAPAVTITGPTTGSTVSGTIAVTASASDDVGVVGVQFKIDGTNLGAEDSSAPYAVTWNTAQTSNGNHALTATARDAAGRTATTAPISVNVNNVAPPPPAPTVTLNASPTSVTSGGGSTLTWSSSNATSCSASGAWSGTKTTSGSASTGALSASSTYTLACTGTGGSASASATVTVTAAPPPPTPAPTVTLNASPTSVTSGGSSTLTWSSTDATSCSASGAWSGAKATAGSSSTGALTNPSNLFTLACTGAGGSTSRSVTVTTTSSSGQTGLLFPSNGQGTTRFQFTGSALVNAFPATYIWKVRPEQQFGYYTTFFWGRADGQLPTRLYYGAHPYPNDPAGDATTHRWEIATYGRDVVTDDNGNDTTVVKGRWYTQALVVRASGNNLILSFYWDLDTSASRVITFTAPETRLESVTNALTFGDAPWNPNREQLSGTLRFLNVYSTNLALADVLAEVASPGSSAAASAALWYRNLNPTPSDIADKSGLGHHPAWVGSNRPALWSGP